MKLDRSTQNIIFREIVQIFAKNSLFVKLNNISLDSIKSNMKVMKNCMKLRICDKNNPRLSSSLIVGGVVGWWWWWGGWVRVVVVVGWVGACGVG